MTNSLIELRYADDTSKVQKNDESSDRFIHRHVRFIRFVCRGFHKTKKSNGSIIISSSRSDESELGDRI